MQRVLLLAGIFVALGLACPAAAQRLTGSGSTFAFPIVAKWAESYRGATGVTVDFEPTGSVAGETDVRADVVDFGITDAPLADAQLLRDGLAQFPLVMGAIVPVVNLDGIAPGHLRLTGEVLANIYLGRVKSWRDPAIIAANPGVAMPDRPILVVYRSDASGTSFNWTDYLSRVSLEWRARVGASTKVAWPAGVGAKGGSGVIAAVARTKGSIGYVEYTAARQSRLTHALAENLAGCFVPPDAESYRATTALVDWAKEPDFAFLLTSVQDPNAYPLMATSFVLMRKYPKEPDRREAMLGFFKWVLEHGQGAASTMDYLPLPDKLTQLVETYWVTDRQ